ncbi:hypothetical protein DVH24_001367 [Malus domestica]|uniref:Uncharacterized protein n=1 Tax=Malus domestica TaxID=3750 RepID=A0A498K613_MALDO|nr:hypothetical protein DVH24_001367 [Malus domestica]
MSASLTPIYGEAAPKSRTRDLPLMDEGTCLLLLNIAVAIFLVMMALCLASMQSITILESDSRTDDVVIKLNGKEESYDNGSSLNFESGSCRKCYGHFAQQTSPIIPHNHPSARLQKGSRPSLAYSFCEFLSVWKQGLLLGCVWYVGWDGTERDKAFRPAFGKPKMGGTGCSTGQILGVFASHLPPGTGLFHVCGTHCFTILRQIYPMYFSKITPSFRPVPSRSVPSRPVPSRPVPFRPVCVPNAPRHRES